MEGISEKFISTLPHGHRVAARVDLLTQGDIIDLSEQGIITGGSVNVSSTETRRAMDLAAIDPDNLWVPTSADDPLAPAGNELRLWRGIDFQDGSDPELVPIGTFRFITTDAPAPQLSLSGMDRSWVVRGNPFDATVTIASGTNVITAINSILLRAVGSPTTALATNFPDLDEVTNTMTFEAETDPWSVLTDLAANVGHDIYFTPLGTLTMVPVPDPTTGIPIWEFDDSNAENLGLPGLQLSWDASDAVNRVVAIGENPDNSTVYRGEAKDTDPNSPTRWDGPFGRRTLIIRDEKIASQAQAESRAKAEMLKRLGIPQSLTIPAMVNPAFEVGDIIQVTSEKFGGYQATAIIDSFSVPLRANEGMTIQTRQRLVTT